MERFLKVGQVTTTHGVHGEVKVFPLTNDAGRFLDLEYVTAEDPEKGTRLEIEKVRFFKNLVILKFKGIDMVEDAAKLRGKDLWIPRELGQELSDDEYYIVDLIGMQVFLEDGTQLGVLKDVLQTGANDVYVVTTPEHKDVLIPAIKDCIRSVDVEGMRMTVSLLKGMLE